MSCKVGDRVRRVSRMNRAEELIPRALKLASHSKAHAAHFQVDEVEAQVSASVKFFDASRYGKATYRVDLLDWECQCRQLKNLGIPCGHAYAAANFFGIPQKDAQQWRITAFASRFRQSEVSQAYAEALFPVTAQVARLPDVVILPFKLASASRGRGRPLEKRLMGSKERRGPLTKSAESLVSFAEGNASEPVRKKPQKIDTCSKCGQSGHRKTSKQCPKYEVPPPKALGGSEVEDNGVDEEVSFFKA